MTIKYSPKFENELVKLPIDSDGRRYYVSDGGERFDIMAHNEIWDLVADLCDSTHDSFEKGGSIITFDDQLKMAAAVLLIRQAGYNVTGCKTFHWSADDETPSYECLVNFYGESNLQHLV